MAFQPSGPCSSSPYKCLHVISSDLYKSILSNNTKCQGNADSSSSAYSAPNIHNNFYPSNNQYFDNSDNDNKKPPPPSDNQSVSPDSPDSPSPDSPDSPSAPPSSHHPPDSPSEDNAPDNDSSDMTDPPNGAPTESPQISSDQNSEINGTVSGVGDQTHSPPIPNAIKIKRLKRKGRLNKIQNQVGRSGRRKRPLGLQNIQQQTPVTADVPQGATPGDTPQGAASSNHETPSVPSNSVVPKFPEAATFNPSKIKSDVKWPSYEERKPDIKPDIKSITRKKIKDEKPLVKRKVNFDRKISDIDETPQHQAKPKVEPEIKMDTTETPPSNPPHQNPLSKIKSNVKWPSFEERKPDVKTFNKKTVKTEIKPLVKRKSNFVRNLPDIMEVDEVDTRAPTPKPILKTEPKLEKMDTIPAPPKPKVKVEPKVEPKLEKMDTIPAPPKPKIKVEPKLEKMDTTPGPSKPRVKIEPKLEKMDTTPVPFKPKIKVEPKLEKIETPKKEFIKIPINPPKNAKWIKTSPTSDDEMETSSSDVRNIHEDEFKKRYKGVRKTIKKPKVSVRKDLFADSKEKVKDRMAVNIFKTNNNSEKKNLKTTKPIIIKKEKVEHIKNEKTDSTDIEFIDVPYMPQHAMPRFPKIKKSKSTIENHPNPKIAHALKKEMIEDMEYDAVALKRKKSSDLPNPAKTARSKEPTWAKNGKRKDNNFGTKPTGYIKFQKVKHEKNGDDKEEKPKSIKKEKKYYGSGFRMWKF